MNLIFGAADDAAEPPPPTVPPAACFSPAAQHVLDRAEFWAAPEGEIGVDHLWLGLIDDPDGVLTRAFEAAAGLAEGSARPLLKAALGQPVGVRLVVGDDPPVWAAEAAETLWAAREFAREQNQGQDQEQHQGTDAAPALITPTHLALALVADLVAEGETMPEVAAGAATLGRLRAYLEHSAGPGPPRPALARPPAGLVVVDLTALGAAGQIAPAVPSPPRGGQLDPIDRLARALHRRGGGHALITGPDGVGKTTLIREVARRAEAGLIPFLRGHRFLWVDARAGGPDRAAEDLALLGARICAARDVVLCVDGLEALCRGAGGADDGAAAFRALVAGSAARVVGIVSRSEYLRQTARDPAALGPGERVDLDEPTEEVAAAITRHAAARLAAAYQIRFDRGVPRQAVRLAAADRSGPCLPAGAIALLQRACADLDYDRDQLGSARRCVTATDLARAAAVLAGLDHGHGPEDPGGQGGASRPVRA